MSAAILRTHSTLTLGNAATSTLARWTGRVLFAFAVLYLAFDAVVKVIQPDFVMKGMTQLGFGAGQIFVLGVICIAALVLYMIPRTAPFGALIWTGYLGGAVETNLRLHQPMFSATLTPVYLAIVMWAALYLRDARVRTVLGANR
jgi:DoxX-like protein